MEKKMVSVTMRRKKNGERRRISSLDEKTWPEIFRGILQRRSNI